MTIDWTQWKPGVLATLMFIIDEPRGRVLLIRKKRGLGAGKINGPGGKIDPGEDAITAALREAEEELALPRAAVRVIGVTDDYATGTGFIVTPVVGVVPPGLPLLPHPSEVAAVFTAPLALLLDRSQWQANEVFWRGANRRYLEMDYQGFRIWGVTAAILANLARRIAWEDLRDVA